MNAPIICTTVKNLRNVSTSQDLTGVFVLMGTQAMGKSVQVMHSLVQHQQSSYFPFMLS